MKKLVRGGSIREVEAKLKAMKDWKPISGIKLDDSLGGYGVIEYVCVVEAPEKKHNTNQSHWRRGFNG